MYPSELAKTTLIIGVWLYVADTEETVEIALTQRKALYLGFSMKFACSSSHRHIQLFENRFFEIFTVFPLVGFLLLWPVLLLTIVVARVSTAPMGWALLLVLPGWLTWTAAEYALHRYVFHFAPQSALMREVIFVIHGNHHADPNDPARNLMPPIISVPVAGLIWALCVWAMGAAGTWFFLGFIGGYVVYDLIHYCCHQFAMKGKFARMLKEHHMHHHFHANKGNYAITGMIWDRLLSTRISSHKTEAQG